MHGSASEMLESFIEKLDDKASKFGPTPNQEKRKFEPTSKSLGRVHFYEKISVRD